jgi:hypothetical protein
VKYLGLHFDLRLTWKDHINKKKKTNRPKNKRAKLATVEKVSSIHRKEIMCVQIHNQTHMELWYRTVGLRQQIQQRRHTRTNQQTPHQIRSPPQSTVGAALIARTS